MDAKSCVALLKKTSSFRGLQDADLQLLATKSTVVKLTNGQKIVEEGERGDSMFVLCSGKAEVFKKSLVDNKNVLIGELHSGDFSGFAAMFDEDAHQASAYACGETVLLKLTFENTAQLLKTCPNFSTGLIRFMTQRIKLERNELCRFRSGNASSKFTICLFDSKPYWIKYFDELKDKFDVNVKYVDTKLTPETAILADGCKAVCIFVNDVCNSTVLTILKGLGIRLVALRCAGFNNVDIGSAESLEVSVTRVPSYSPYAVAEFALTLFLSLNRKITRAYNRTRTGNFSLNGLVGTDVNGKTIGVIGTGKIGQIFANIMLGMGCKLLCHDVFVNPELANKPNVFYVPLDQLLAESDVISLYAPLMPTTKHMIDDLAIGKMKHGVLLINTSRGALVDTSALIRGLKSGKIGGAGLDVYEEESDYFFQDKSDENIIDDCLVRLLSFNNVIVTSHQAFFTEEALRNIATSSLASAHEFKSGSQLRALTNSCFPTEKK
eukprot:Sdes_comp20524_c0_seq1m15132